MTNLEIVEAFVRAEYVYEGVTDPLTVACIEEIGEVDEARDARPGDFWIRDEVTGLIVRVHREEGIVETVWRNW